MRRAETVRHSATGPPPLTPKQEGGSARRLRPANYPVERLERFAMTAAEQVGDIETDATPAEIDAAAHRIAERADMKGPSRAARGPKALWRKGIAFSNEGARLQVTLLTAPAPPENLIVWRRVPADVASKAMANLKIGEVFPLHGFQSTSLSPEVALGLGFAGENCTVLEIKPKCGAYIAGICLGDANELEQSLYEREFVIPSGRRYRVVGILYAEYAFESFAGTQIRRTIQLETLG